MHAGDWDVGLLEPILAMQFNAHEAQLLQAGPADDYIVMVGTPPAAAPAGRLVVMRRATEWHVADISIDIPYRRQGIGTRLLAWLQTGARTGGVPLRLHCLRTNPAVRLYLRLGFRCEGPDGGTHLLLSWAPGAAE